ncbi:MAG TPA: hypothetical protein VIN07_10595, partial [Flavipsychrobacter sp.]
MTTGKSGQYRPGTTQTSKWSAKQWFLLYGAILLVWAALYLLGHSRLGIPGYEHTRFTTADIRHINSILVAQAPTPAQQPPAYRRQRITNTNDGFLDSYPDDSTEPGHKPYIATFPESGSMSNMNEGNNDRDRVKKAMIYLASQYGEEIDSDQMATIQQYISTFTPRETGIFLADYRLRVRSFFWLSGIMLYAEVVSWVVFGVICSLLFFIGKNSANSGGLTQRTVFFQSARLLYAPFAAVIFVLVYSYLKGSATLHVEASELVIILGFIFGFYSGAVMEVLDRLRGNTATPGGNEYILDTSETQHPVSDIDHNPPPASSPIVEEDNAVEE